MTTVPAEWTPPDPETLEDAIRENNRLRRILGALAAHGPTVLNLAKAASVIGGDRYRGTLCAYEAEIWNARRLLDDIRRERTRSKLVRGMSGRISAPQRREGSPK